MSRSSYSRQSPSWRSNLYQWSSHLGMKLLEMSSGKLAKSCVPPNSILKVAGCWWGVLTPISGQTILSGEWQAHAFKREYFTSVRFQSSQGLWLLSLNNASEMSKCCQNIWGIDNTADSIFSANCRDASWWMLWKLLILCIWNSIKWMTLLGSHNWWCWASLCLTELTPICFQLNTSQ